MQLPLLSSVIGSKSGEFLKSLPVNLEPVVVDSKISKGQFRIPAGAKTIATGPGVDRGGITWQGAHYRAMSAALVKWDGYSLTIIGGLPAGGYVAFDYSFDRMIIGAAGNLYYFAPSIIGGDGITQVTDPDLGTVIDAIWIDGYTMTTDGNYVVVTELSDPFQIKPLKYGSAEQDPDPITGLIRYRGEAYVLGRHTIQPLQNVGGNGFPFAPVKGGLIPVGCVGPAAKCLLGDDSFAFVGSSRDGALNVYLVSAGGYKPIGNRAICDALAECGDETGITIEARSDRNESRLIVHTECGSYCYLAGVSDAAGEPVWFELKSSDGDYRLRHACKFGNSFICGDLNSSALGEISNDDLRHFGEEPGWKFTAGLIYNEGKGGILHALELVGLPGRGTGKGAVFLSFSRDGQTWSQERSVVTKPGLPGRRLQWRPHVRFGQWLGLKFRGTGGGMPGIAAVELTNIVGLDQ